MRLNPEVIEPKSTEFYSMNPSCAFVLMKDGKNRTRTVLCKHKTVPALQKEAGYIGHVLVSATKNTGYVYEAYVPNEYDVTLVGGVKDIRASSTDQDTLRRQESEKIPVAYFRITKKFNPNDFDPKENWAARSQGIQDIVVTEASLRGEFVSCFRNAAVTAHGKIDAWITAENKRKAMRS